MTEEPFEHSPSQPAADSTPPAPTDGAKKRSKTPRKGTGRKKAKKQESPATAADATPKAAKGTGKRTRSGTGKPRPRRTRNADPVEEPGVFPDQAVRVNYVRYVAALRDFELGQPDDVSDGAPGAGTAPASPAASTESSAPPVLPPLDEPPDTSTPLTVFLDSGEVMSAAASPAVAEERSFAAVAVAEAEEPQPAEVAAFDAETEAETEFATGEHTADEAETPPFAARDAEADVGQWFAFDPDELTDHAATVDSSPVELGPSHDPEPVTAALDAVETTTADDAPAAEREDEPTPTNAGSTYGILVGALLVVAAIIALCIMH